MNHDPPDPRRGAAPTEGGSTPSFSVAGEAAPAHAPELPVATFREDSLLPVEPPQLPSERWRRRGHRVIAPVIGVSVLSALGVGVLAGGSEPLKEIGVGLLFAMPVLVSALLALMRPDTTKRETAGDVALVHGVNVIVAAVFAREGAICLLFLAPFLYVATLPIALGTKAVAKRVLARRDQRFLQRHRGKLGLVLALLVPLGARALDHALYAGATTTTTLTSTLRVSAPPERVWASLRRLDLRFSAPAATSWDALLPVPVALSGEGARLGARRTIHFDNGVVTATVTALVPPRRYDIDLQVQATGREFFDHWIDLRSSRFDIDDDGAGGSVIVHATTYRPLMYPRVAFEPLERFLGGLIQQRLLDVYGAEALGPAPSSTGPLAAR